jgi:hypothetical protein
MKTQTIKTYNFEELSEEAKEKARQWYREAASYDDWHFDFKDLESFLGSVDAGNGLVEQFERGNYCSNTVDLIKANLIDSVEILELDTYRGHCRVTVNYNFLDDVLRHVINSHQDFTAPQRKFLNKVLNSGDLYVGHYEEVEYSNYSWKQVKEEKDQWSKFFPDGKASELVEKLNVLFKDYLEDCQKDFEDYCLSHMRCCEDYRNSDEYIDEAITCNEYDFTEDGEKF